MSPNKCQSTALNPWHGSVEKSTDTLVPILETTKSTSISNYNQPKVINMIDSVDLTDDLNGDNNRHGYDDGIFNNVTIYDVDQYDIAFTRGDNCISSRGINDNIIGLGGDGINSNGNGSSIMNSIISPNGRKSRTISTSSQMDESIFIQPEYVKLDINSGINSSTTNHYNNCNRTDLRRRNSINSSYGKNYDYNVNKYYINGR